MLVYDSFDAYVTDTVKASFKRKHTDLAVTPGGLTSLLQPLDVSLNKPFKDGVRKEWMADGIHEGKISAQPHTSLYIHIWGFIIQCITSKMYMNN